MEIRSGGFAAAIIAALSFTNAGAGEHTTGTGIVLKTVNPDGVTIAVDGKELAIPGGAPFSMSQTEVTQAQFERLLGHNPAETDAEHLPVDRVRATEAAAFCKALTERDRAAGILPEGKVYRLPTIREWLLAALPGGIVPAADAVGATTWHKDNSAGLLHPVGAKTANAYGLQDIIGNAAEWVTPDPALTASLVAEKPEQFSTRTVVQATRPPVAKDAPDFPAKVFFAIQREIIKSQKTLDLVIEKLALDKKWSVTPFEAFKRLKSNIEVREVRGTDLIEIHYQGDEGQEAAQIADAIADSYKKRLEVEQRTRADMAIAELIEAIEKQQEKLEKSRTKMLDLMEKLNIVDLAHGEPAWMRGAPVLKGDKLKAALDGLEGQDRIAAAADLGLPNAVLRVRYPEFQGLLVTREALLKSGLKNKHPKVVALDRQIEQLQIVLLEAIEMATHAEKIAKKPAVPAEKAGLAERRQNIVYIESKKDYQLNKEVLNSMQTQLAKTKIDTRSPSHRIIVHEHAVIPLKPSRPPGVDHPIAIGGCVYDEPDDLADPRSTDPDARTAGVGFRFVLADEG